MAAKSCEVCSAPYQSDLARSRFCSARCRKVAFKQRHASAEPLGTQEGTGGTLAAVRAQLESAGRSETYLGAAAMALATRIDQSTAVMGFAALVKQLQSTMDAAMAGVQVADDPIDELRLRRDTKRVG